MLKEIQRQKISNSTRLQQNISTAIGRIINYYFDLKALCLGNQEASQVWVHLHDLRQADQRQHPRDQCQCDGHCPQTQGWPRHPCAPWHWKKYFVPMPRNIISCISIFPGSQIRLNWCGNLHTNDCQNICAIKKFHCGENLFTWWLPSSPWSSPLPPHCLVCHDYFREQFSDREPAQSWEL